MANHPCCGSLPRKEPIRARALWPSCFSWVIGTSKRYIALLGPGKGPMGCHPLCNEVYLAYPKHATWNLVMVRGYNGLQGLRTVGARRRDTSNAVVSTAVLWPACASNIEPRLTVFVAS